MKRSFAIALIVVAFGAGWFSAKQRYEPAPQPQIDNRTPLQKRLFRLNQTERRIETKVPWVWYRIKTDCTGGIYVHRQENDDQDDWIADPEGNLLEHRRTIMDGYFPRRNLYSLGVTEPIEYKEQPWGAAKANWEVVVWSTKPQKNGFDGVSHQQHFTTLLDDLAKHLATIPY